MNKKDMPKRVMALAKEQGIELELDAAVPGTINIVIEHLKRADELRKAMNRWPRPKEDKVLLKQLRELKAILRHITGDLMGIEFTLLGGIEQQGAVDEVLEFEYAHRVACNNYLIRLKRYFKGVKIG